MTTRIQIRLSDTVAKPFLAVHRDVKAHGHTYYICGGGRGSTKSSYISQEILLLMMQHRDCNAVILRKVANTLRNSVYRQMEWALDTLHLNAFWEKTVNPMEFVRRSTGQKILFLGVDDKSKLKSLKMPHGYVGIVWFEELDQFSGPEEIRSVNQSLLRGGPVFWCFGSYNPPQSANNWVNEEMLLDQPDRLVHHSDYRSVPADWLGAQFLEDADRLRQRNERAYRHEYLGEVTGTGGTVFENVRERAITAAEIESFDRLHYGLDFGFAVDPLAFVCMHYDRKREILYIFDEIYEPKLTNSRAAAMIRGKMTESGYVRADSAEPKSIRELAELGVRIYGARKGPDSVDYGIRWLQSLDEIVIDKRRCPNTYREFVGYEYERNREGQFISAYPDKNNHAIDAVRYGCEDLMPVRPGIRAGRLEY